MAKQFQVFDALTGRPLTKAPASRRDTDVWFDRNVYQQEIRQEPFPHDPHGTTIAVFVLDTSL